MARFRFRLLFAFISFVLLLFLLICGKHKTSKPIDANYMIIEGWSTKIELEKACNYIDRYKPDTILVNGRKMPYNSLTTSKFVAENKKALQQVTFEKPVSLIASGFFLIQTTDSGSIQQINKIAVKARGSDAFNFFAHFNVVVNDKVIDHFFTTEKDSLFEVYYADTIRSIIIYYDNDAYQGKGKDRNLVVSDVQINDVSVSKGDVQIYKYMRSSYDNYPRGFLSRAEEAINYLEGLGINNLKLIAVPSQYSEVNKTYTNALAIRNWAEENNIRGQGFNVLTSSEHSRRSYVNYKIALKNNLVGVIPIEGVYGYTGNLTRFEKIKSYLDESMSILGSYFYWMVNWVKS